MGRSSMDFNFDDCVKPCGLAPLDVAPDKEKDCLGRQCHLWRFCNLKGKKNPWREAMIVGRLPA